MSSSTKCVLPFSDMNDLPAQGFHSCSPEASYEALVELSCGLARSWPLCSIPFGVRKY